MLQVTLAGRLAMRDARRQWQASLLLVAVLAAVVGTCTGYLMVSHNDDLSLAQRIQRALGSADARVTVALESDAPLTVASLLDRPDIREGLAGANLTPVVDLATNARVGDRTIGIKLELLDTSSPSTAPLLVSRAGTRPSSDAEIAVSQEVAARLGLAVGSPLAVSGFSEPLRVAQVVADPVDTRSLFVIMRLSDSNLRQAQSAGSPGSLSITYLVRASREQLQSSGLAYLDRQGVTDRAQSTGMLTAPLFAGAVLATTVVTMAGFLTISRRQRRTAGLLDIAGADFGTRLATLLVAGLVLALLGCVVGVLVGMGAAVLLQPWLAARAHQIWAPASVPWPATLAVSAAGLLSACLVVTVIAFSTARYGARQVVGARDSSLLRSGRGRVWITPAITAAGALTMVVGGLVGRSSGAAIVGAIVLACGAALLVVGSATWIQDHYTAGPAWMRMAGRSSRRLPSLTRGLTLAVAGVGTLCCLTGFLLSSLSLGTGYVPALPPGASQFGSTQQLTDAQLRQAALILGATRTAQYREAWRSGPGGLKSYLQVRNPLYGCVQTSSGDRSAIVRDCTRTTGFMIYSPLVAFVSDSDAAGLLGDAWSPTVRREFEKGVAIARYRQLVDVDGRVHLEADATVGNGGGGSSPASPESGADTVVLPAITVPAAEQVDSAPAVLLPLKLRGTHGLITANMWQSLLVGAQPPTPEQEDAARSLLVGTAMDGQLTVERGDPRRDLAEAVITAAAVVLGVSMSLLTSVFVALSALQVRRESAILSALGADRRFRRRVSSSQAALPVGLGLMIAFMVGALGARICVAIEHGWWFASAAWPLAASVAGVTVLALTVGWFTAPARPTPVRAFE